MCISVERLSAVATADEFLFTPEEIRHLNSCQNCFEDWANRIAESGRCLTEGDEDGGPH